MALFHAFNGPETSTLVRYVPGTAQSEEVEYRVACFVRKKNQFFVVPYTSFFGTIYLFFCCLFSSARQSAARQLFFRPFSYIIFSL